MKSRSMDGLRNQERSADFTGNRQVVMKHRRSGVVPVRVYRLPFTVYRLPFTVYRLPFTVYRLPFTVHWSPITAIASAIRGIELLQRIAAGTQVLLAELVERRLHGAQVRMQVFRLGIDV